MLISFSIEAFSQDEQKEDTILSNYINEIGTKGYYNLKHNINLDSAEFYLKKALDLQYTTNNYKIDYRVADNHVLLASFYRTIYNNEEALENLNKAEHILKETDPNDQLFASLYHNKGNIYKTKNDFYRTKEYYEYSLDFLVRNGFQNTTDFPFVFSNYVNLLLEVGEYELAEKMLSEFDIASLEIDPQIELRIHLTNANSYSKLGKFESALYHFKEANKIIEDRVGINTYEIEVTKYYYNVIDFYIYYNLLDEALSECVLASAFVEALDPHSTKCKVIYLSDILYRTATIHFRKGNTDRALQHVNIVIRDLNDFLKELYSDDPNSNARNEYSTPLPDLNVLKSRILLDKFRSSSSIEDLHSAFEAYKQAIETLNYMKLAMRDEDSKLFATSQILEVYYEAIYVAKLLYEETGEFHYLEKSFEFAETSKSFALYSEIKEIEAMEFSDLPADIRVKEKRLMGEIQAYEEWLYKQQVSENPDIDLIESYKEKLFHLKDDYNDLKQEIELNYSQYYELKYNPKFVSMREVQKELPYRDALIEYVHSDTILITYIIDRKGINTVSQKIGPEFSDECIEYYRLLHSQNFSSGVHENYRRFVSLGRKFYSILIEPALQYTDRKSFTIVPDGAITYLPFECFITEETDTEYINYRMLPYMIRDFSVGYSHSSTLMFSERLKTKSPKAEVLAFAPVYKSDIYNLIDTTSIRQTLKDTDFLIPLAGTIKEVQRINETVPSRVFLNENATEANFKKYASDYNVLHLAMHTIMKDDDPLYSMLAFTNVETTDSIEDNKLYAYEIYNMKLNAQMVVLSSCNSGFGKMRKGEGMMSLARGFMYAGCPSIIMTLWQVADKSSSDLMTSFYKYLKKGRSKQEAMRLAKIDYLETADELTSNPYFWSAFVVLGDGSPIYRRSGMAYWMIVITIFIGLVVFVQSRRSRRF